VRNSISATDIGQRIAAVYALKGFLTLVRRQLWRPAHMGATSLSPSPALAGASPNQITLKLSQTTVGGRDTAETRSAISG
jgi:hypothetical protein